MTHHDGIPLALRPSRLRTNGAITWAMRLVDRIIDRHLGVDTEAESRQGGGAASVFGDDHIYAPVRYLTLWRFLSRIDWSPDDVFVDIGCGLGRPLMVMARHALTACIGIEYDPALAERGRHNARALRGRRCPIEIVCADAAAADYNSGTVFWLANPFGPRTLETVLERIHQSTFENPRAIKIIYVHPEFMDVFERANWLIYAGAMKIPGASTVATYWSYEPPLTTHPSRRP